VYDTCFFISDVATGSSRHFKFAFYLIKTFSFHVIHTQEATKRGDCLRGEGKTIFPFYQSAQEVPKIKKQKSFHLSWFCVVLSLVLFTVLFILSYFAILCNSFVIHAWNGGRIGRKASGELADPNRSLQCVV
jgi:hypothetical protein